MPVTQISAVQIKGHSPRPFNEDRWKVKKTPLDKKENSCTTEAEANEQGKEQRDRCTIKGGKMPTMHPYCDNKCSH